MKTAKELASRLVAVWCVDDNGDLPALEKRIATEIERIRAEEQGAARSLAVRARAKALDDAALEA